MDRYLEKYQAVTGKTLPAVAVKLAPLFDQMQAEQVVPPKGQSG